MHVVSSVLGRKTTSNRLCQVDFDINERRKRSLVFFTHKPSNFTHRINVMGNSILVTLYCSNILDDVAHAQNILQAFVNNGFVLWAATVQRSLQLF